MRSLVSKASPDDDRGWHPRLKYEVSLVNRGPPAIAGAGFARPDEIRAEAGIIRESGNTRADGD
ncbi:MAG TPA: hypothetical protein VMB73_24815 [Acetobacteraceae bacterium]|jgi:hypothetical protein|nr:hypothetical protein [Acetobacteraceae bacterium]